MKKLLILLPLLFITTSCSNNSPILGNDVPTITGVNDFMYRYDNDGNLIALLQHNFGDCSGQEEFYNYFKVNTLDTYVISFDITYTGSKSIKLIGDSVNIAPIENYFTFNYLDNKNNDCLYEITFKEKGTYFIYYSYLTFSNKLMVEVE